MRLMNWMLLTGVLVFGLAVYTPSFAQGSAETNKDEIELTRAIIKVQKKQIVAKNMNLTLDEKDQFWAVYREYQGKMDFVANQRVQIITDYADTLKDGSLNNEKALVMLNQYLVYESRRLNVKQTYVKKFQEVLPSLKVVRFFQIENKFEAIINMQLAKQIPLVQ